MAMTVAGFSGGEAEELRRAMGFKRSTRGWKRSNCGCATGWGETVSAARSRLIVAHHLIRAVWIPRIACRQLRADCLRVVLFKMPSSGGFFRRDAQLLSARLLPSGDIGKRRERP